MLRLLRGFRVPVLLLSQAEGIEDVLLLRPTGAAGGAQGDVLGHLYRTQRLPLVRLAVLVVGDQATAEDVVQDAFAEVCRRWRALDDGTSVVPYLRRAVVNGARSVLRRRRVANAFRPDRQHHVHSAEDAALLLGEHRALLAALHRLAPRQREILALRYWVGLSEAEIAETMGISRGAVKSMAHRSLAALRNRLEG
ncbi:sigma-70 family RNA polymerase sigma factor [Streptomyces sp. NPDC005500]|uniref:sigma-70 family RNA polymerase sigma factor n=1 Tax=Streptomyces sp. NPDC005500 TaxID=3155007 RepID=UPI0033A419AB